VGLQLSLQHPFSLPSPFHLPCLMYLPSFTSTPRLLHPQCPNGKDCKYRHALPPGYVLKSQMKELLELEAANVGCQGVGVSVCGPGGPH
jgi:hypothetical protein